MSPMFVAGTASSERPAPLPELSPLPSGRCLLDHLQPALPLEGQDDVSSGSHEGRWLQYLS